MNNFKITVYYNNGIIEYYSGDCEIIDNSILCIKERGFSTKYIPINNILKWKIGVE